MKYLDLNFCSDPLAVNALPSERYSRMGWFRAVQVLVQEGRVEAELQV